MPDLEFIRQYAAESAQVIGALAGQAEGIEEIGRALIQCLQGGGKVLACGNGGSAAEAMHLCEELTGKYCKPRRALAAVCLNADPTALTCIANDWDFASVFARQVEALGRPGDALVVFSTSGNSENLLRALGAARKAGVRTVGLLGRGGGKALGLCELSLVIEARRGSHVQEAHQAVLHLLLEQIDAAFTA